MALTKEQKEKIKKLKEQMEKKNQEQKEKKREKKQKTHNLIVLGALAFKYSKCDRLNEDFIKKFEAFLKNQEVRGGFYSQCFKSATSQAPTQNKPTGTTATQNKGN